MQLVYSSKAEPVVVDQRIAKAMDVSQDWLRQVVDRVSIPRHFIQQPQNNQSVARWLDEQLRSFGYQTQWQGAHRNLLATANDSQGPLVLVGAHYDSVPTTPGADDNASAVAALLACAKATAEHAPHAPVCFVAFNREEEDLTGSQDFVANFLPGSKMQISEVHVLEMVGCCDRRPGSQRIPAGLPIKVRDTGDFLGVIGNHRSKALVDSLTRCARGYTPELSVIGLKIYFGLEKRIRHFVRSDHAPFWEAGIPALMWTDTAEFRNPNYHQPSDTPETLDYDFLQQVARLLIARVLSVAS